MSTLRVCSALLSLFAAAGCGAGEVTLVLDRVDAATVPRPGAIRVLFQVIGVADPVRFDPVDLDDPGEEGRRFADIPPGEEMYADVFGCPSTSACGAGDIVARGCSQRFFVTAGESLEVPVTLELPADGANSCDAAAAGP